MKGIGNGKKKGKKKENKRTLKNPMESRDVPLPKTLDEDLKPYDTNNDGVLSQEERIAMNLAKNVANKKEELQKNRDEKRSEEMKNRSKRGSRNLRRP